MRVTKALAAAAIAASFGIGPGQAQSSDSGAVPAEFPPSSYTGRQYVDSQGCVFVRAGVDGNVSWVPRMTRDRQLICGFKPSLPGIARPEETRTATAQPTAAPEEKQQAPEATPNVVRRAPEAETASGADQVKVVRRAPDAKEKATPEEPAMPPAEKIVEKSTPSEPPADRRRVACEGGSDISREYLRAGAGVTVRCGPQETPHVSSTEARDGRPVPVLSRAPEAKPARKVVRVVRPKAQPAPARSGAKTRAAPRAVQNRQVRGHSGIRVPDGYKPVWEDDRLNPRRGQQTARGKASMELVWSKTVPRHLIERETGRDVSYKYPGLQYPYTSFDDQRSAGVTVATRGRVVPDPVREERGRTISGKIEDRQGALVQRASDGARESRRTTVSTRSASGAADSAPARQQTKPRAPSGGHRYVQAGVFGVPTNAKRAARRLADAGLPARMGRMTRGGKTYTLVLAGPFDDRSALHAALAKTRRAGFSDAYLRK
ncbi:MAG: SPOR domain-containing protein [Roseovarius sp.]|nr:SPOR domain-containing protein [Roseovarius sp.]